MKREDSLEILLSLSGDPLALIDADGCFSVANPAFAAVFGRTVEEIEGLAVPGAGLPPMVAEEMTAAIPRVLRDGAVVTVGALTLRPLAAADGTVGAVAVVGGGSEAALRGAVERLRSSKAQFVAVANHDLRQPFQAIQLFHHLLASRVSDRMAVDLCDKLGEAIQGAETMIRAMMEVTSLEHGLIRPAARAVAIDDVLARLLSGNEVKATAKGLDLRVRPGEAVVVSDPDLLERLLGQLVANAVRFTERGGVMLAARRRGGALRVEVWDTGPGLPDGDRPTLLDDDAPVGGARGRGFGLTIVRRLARLLGHPLTVASRVGRGTMVAVTLPLAGGETVAAD